MRIGCVVVGDRQCFERVMARQPSSPLSRCTLADLRVRDARVFQRLPAYDALRQALIDDDYLFLVHETPRHDRVLFLNLTFWGVKGGGDVLPNHTIDADVICHAAWHHLCSKWLGAKQKPTAQALLLGEAIASAYDVYLVGVLLTQGAAASRSSFMQTQVPAMAETAKAAGLSARGFEQLLTRLADDPSAAFEGLRALLFDLTTALLHVDGVEAAARVLSEMTAKHEGGWLAPLLHRFELATWILFARAYGRTAKRDASVEKLDRALRESDDALAFLSDAWLGGTLNG
jgi:hypothetical protein